MTRKFHVILEYDANEEVWVSYVPSLNFLSTFGETRDEVLEHTREAILLYLEGLEEDELELSGASSHTEVVDVEVQAS